MPKPFTLEWWLKIRDGFIWEYMEIRFKTMRTNVTLSVQTPEEKRIDEILDVIDFISNRIVEKYGE